MATGVDLTMNYTDHVFFVFILVTLPLYYAARSARAQIAVLILASLVFYAWEAAPLLAVFLASWLITSSSSYVVLATQSARLAKTMAAVGVICNLAFLGFFKYKFLFLSKALIDAHSPAQNVADWLILSPLPIGISFYTFHGISLLVDTFRSTGKGVFRKPASLAEHLSHTLLYLAFFPQLIAGPIIKAKDFYPQVRQKRLREIDFGGAVRALIVGYFLKAVVADNLAEQTTWIAYPQLQWRSTGDLLAMLFGYSAQIFADFAGYSLIAIGLGRLLGYRLPANFNFPYLSTSIADFWRRWHISLSSWLRDYLYLPLGGSRYGPWRTYLNLLVVMFLGGLWHGAAWSFAVWGLWHGVGLALERPWLNSRLFTTDNIAVVLMRTIVVFVFVTLGWLLFKLPNFSDAWLYLKTMARPQTNALSTVMILLIVLYGSGVLLYHLASLNRRALGPRFRDVAYGVMFFLVLTNAGPSKPFIYFQF